MRLALLLCLVALPAGADCAGEVIFSCPIKAKMLQVCLTDAEAIYSFGKRGHPDLTITTPLAELDYRPWPGIGSTIWDEVHFTNDGVDYAVWSSIDKLMDENAPEPQRQGGVTVTRADETLAELTCARSPDPGFLDGIYDAMTNAGLCWDPEFQQWGGCGD